MSSKPNNAIDALNTCNNNINILKSLRILATVPGISIAPNERLFLKLNQIKTYSGITIAEVSTNTFISNTWTENFRA